MPTEKLTYDKSLDRFSNNCCPTCGKKMEDRDNAGDKYCHKCRESWTVDKVFLLREKLPLW